MKLLHCVVFLSTFLLLCEGKVRTKRTSIWRDDLTTTTATTTTTTPTTPTTTTTTPTTTNPTTVVPRVNLRGRMMTLSRNTRVTFCRPTYCKVSPTAWPTTMTTTTTTATTTKPITTTAPVTGGLSVCLRFLTDSSSLSLFSLSASSYYQHITFNLNEPWYTLDWCNPEYGLYQARGDYQVSLKPMIPVWPSVRPQSWTSVCVVMDNVHNVVQVFQGGLMSIEKITQPGVKWSGNPEVTLPGFDGQVTDVEVWDYPLKNKEIFSFMQNFGSRGTVLTWSDINWYHNGPILVQDTYALGHRRPISSSEGEEQPIRSGKGRDQRLRRRKKFNGWKQGRSQMI